MNSPLSIALELTGAAVALSDLRLELPSDADPFALPNPAVVGRKITELGALITTMGDAYLRRTAEPAQQGFPAEAFAIALNRAGQTVSALGTVGQQLSALATMPTGPSGLPGSDYTRTLAATCIDEALQAAHRHLQDGVRVLRDAAEDALPATARSQQAALARSLHTATAQPSAVVPPLPLRSGPSTAGPGEPPLQLHGVTMLDEDVRHHAKALQTAADSLADGQAVLPQSFDSVYRNGRQVSVSALTEAVKQVEWPLREALNEASFHALSSRQDAYTVFLARAWTSAANDLAQASRDFTEAADLTAALADARVRAPDAAPEVEEQVRTGVNHFLSEADAAVDRAIVTMQSSYDALTSGRPLPAPATAEDLASASEVQLDPNAARRAAALTRSTTTPASATDPQHPAPAAPGASPSSVRGRR
ncbi:hypothetical protein ACFVT9_28195 [Kitasatospora cineracea]|uniref:hypothetical protein n=1 Tax=Kitasatospora cineracea TaxID=88074 RepID=UPI0036DC3D42